MNKDEIQQLQILYQTFIGTIQSEPNKRLSTDQVLSRMINIGLITEQEKEVMLNELDLQKQDFQK